MRRLPDGRSSRIEESKDSRTQAVKDHLLREEAGSGAIVPAGIASPVRAELDPAAAEVEARRAREPPIGPQRELIAGAVHLQFLPTDKSLPVGQDDGADRKRIESELVADEDLACPTDRTTTMAQSKLGGNDQDVALLRFGDQIQCVGRAGMNPQLSRCDLAFAVVVELPRGSDLGVDELDGTAVALGRVFDFREESGSQGVDRRDGEPSLGTLGKFGKILRELEGLSGIEAEDLGDSPDLSLNRPWPRVLRRVSVARPHLLVGELVGPRQLSDEIRDSILQFSAVLVESLRGGFVESRLVEGGSTECDILLAPRVIGRDQCPF